MQKVSIIIGRKQEGKTKELVDNYINHFIDTVSGRHYQDTNLRDIVRPVFIAAGADTHNPIQEYIEKLEASDELPLERKETILNDLRSYDHFHSVADKDELKDLVHEMLSEKDCVFYIDNVDTIMGVDEVVDLCNSYPRMYVGQSADFEVTITLNNNNNEKA